MTRYVPQWLQSGTYAASLDRRLIGALWPAPASTGCAVAAAGTGMDVHVDPGQVAVPSPNNSGSVLCTSDAIETLTLAPAPPQNTDRVDLIVCQPRSTDLGGTSEEDFIFAIVKGPEGAPPGAPPATPAGTVALARVHVTGGAASIAAGDISDIRPFGLAIGGPTVLPPPLAAADPFRSFTDDSGEVWVAKGGVNGGLWKRARDVLACRVYRGAAGNFTNTQTGLAFDTVTRDPYGIWQGSGNLACPLPGLWLATGTATCNATANAQWITTRLVTPHGDDAQSNGITSMAAYLAASVSATFMADAGSVINLNVWTSVNLAAVPGPQFCYLALTYLGTG